MKLTPSFQRVMISCVMATTLDGAFSVLSMGLTLNTQVFSDMIVGNITNTTIPTLELTNQSMYSGYTWANGYTYYTDVRYVSGLLQNTSIGINHNLTVMTEKSNAADGLVAVFRVAIHEYPENSA